LINRVVYMKLVNIFFFTKTNSMRLIQNSVCDTGKIEIKLLFFFFLKVKLIKLLLKTIVIG